MDMIETYTNGDYIDICQLTQDAHGGSGPWENRQFHLNDVDESVAAAAEDLYQMISNATGAPEDLTRTEVDWSGATMHEGAPGRSERFGMRPEVGQRLSWGVKSTSAAHDWAQQVARMEAPGMSMCAKRNGYSHIRDGAEVVAYHVQGATRYLDISGCSPYDQDERLVCGDYIVTDVVEEDIPTSAEKPNQYAMITAAEQAAREGVEPEWFTSKKGNAMVRYGNHVYPAEFWDQPKIALMDEPICFTAHIVHIYLKEA